MAYHQSRCNSNGASPGRPGSDLLPHPMEFLPMAYRRWRCNSNGVSPGRLGSDLLPHPSVGGFLATPEPSTAFSGETSTVPPAPLFRQLQLQQQRESQLGHHPLHEFPYHNSSPKSSASPARDSDNNSNNIEILLSVEARKVSCVLAEHVGYLFTGLCPPCLQIVQDLLNSLAKGELSSIKAIARLEGSSSPSCRHSFRTLTDPWIASERICLNENEAASGESNRHIEALSSNGHITFNSREADGEDDSLDETASSGRTEQAEKKRSHHFQLNIKKGFSLMERVNNEFIHVVQGLELHENIFSSKEQRQLVYFIEELLRNKTISSMKDSKLHASHVEFGRASSDIDESGHLVSRQAVETIPDIFKATIKQLKQRGVIPESCEPDNCSIDIHDEGTYVLPWKEQLNIRRPFFILSLLNSCNIIFGSKLEGPQSADSRGLPVFLPIGSVLVLNGKGADIVKHAIPSAPMRRICVTFREIIPGGSGSVDVLQDEKSGDVIKHVKVTSNLDRSLSLNGNGSIEKKIEVGNKKNLGAARENKGYLNAERMHQNEIGKGKVATFSSVTKNASSASYMSSRCSLSQLGSLGSNSKESSVKSLSSEDPILRVSGDPARLAQVAHKKDFQCMEFVNGKKVNIVEGLELHTNVLNSEEQNFVTNFIYNLQERGRKGWLRERTYSEPKKWMRGKGRVTIQFGCCYNYAKDRNGNPPGIIREEEVDPIPEIFRSIIKRMLMWKVLPRSCVPDSCIVNIYDVADCIPPHVDHHDFLRPFCTLSLLNECNIIFGSNLQVLGPGNFEGTTSIPLPVGSVLILNGNGADVAKHAVPSVPKQRISITFRKMDPSKVPYTFRPDTDLLSTRVLSFQSSSSGMPQKSRSGVHSHQESPSSSLSQSNSQSVPRKSSHPESPPAYSIKMDFPPLQAARPVSTRSQQSKSKE